MNSKLFSIKDSVTLKMAEIARTHESKGESVIKLQTGDPDFKTHRLIIDAAEKAMKDGFTHYSDIRGLPVLRKALSTKFSKENNVIYEPDTEILITHGASNGIFVTIQALIEAGDEVIILEPSYMNYAASVIFAGGIPVFVETDKLNGFRIDIEKLNQSITKRTKLIIINSPNNPSGNVIDKVTLEHIAEICMKNDIYVLSDEVYEKIIYDTTEFTSIASINGMKNRTATINSFSKTFAMTGWRLGYVGASKEIISNILKVLAYTITNIAPFTQLAGLMAIESNDVNNYTNEMLEIYCNRRNIITKLASREELFKTIIPDGAFYTMIDISQYSKDSTDFSMKLLEKEKVCTVPGIAFGKVTEGWVRITFAANEETIIKGLTSLCTFIRTNYNK